MLRWGEDNSDVVLFGVLLGCIIPLWAGKSNKSLNSSGSAHKRLPFLLCTGHDSTLQLLFVLIISVPLQVLSSGM